MEQTGDATVSVLTIAKMPTDGGADIYSDDDTSQVQGRSTVNAPASRRTTHSARPAATHTMSNAVYVRQDPPGRAPGRHGAGTSQQPHPAYTSTVSQGVQLHTVVLNDMYVLARYMRLLGGRWQRLIPYPYVAYTEQGLMSLEAASTSVADTEFIRVALTRCVLALCPITGHVVRLIYGCGCAFIVVCKTYKRPTYIIIIQQIYYTPNAVWRGTVVMHAVPAHATHVLLSRQMG